jgi:Transposase DDE domain group 1
MKERSGTVAHADHASPPLLFDHLRIEQRGPPHPMKMTRMSCHRFWSNEVRLWLSVMADNLGNPWRRLALPNRIDHWSLTSVQQRLMKTGCRLVTHARYYWLWLAEGHLTRRVFGAIARRIAALRVPPG